jgi:hypothetical protein
MVSNISMAKTTRIPIITVLFLMKSADEKAAIILMEPVKMNTMASVIL